jgi:hypothetical protein
LKRSARRIAVNVAKLRDLLRKARQPTWEQAEPGNKLKTSEQFVCYDAVTA